VSSYYECHVTLLGDPETIRPHVERLKWKFSCIDGDPVLGEGVKCYATRQFSKRLDIEAVQTKLFRTAYDLKAARLEVIRRKVELVIYDDRSSKVRCNGGCPECHLDDLCDQENQ
jgi:hypothetical protein